MRLSIGLLVALEIHTASGDPLEEACRRLVGLANEAGGTDNVTVAMAAAGGTPSPDA